MFALVVSQRIMCANRRLLSHAQLLVDAAEQGSGHKKTLIPEEEAQYSYQQVGTPEKGWLAFQVRTDISTHIVDL